MSKISKSLGIATVLLALNGCAGTERDKDFYNERINRASNIEVLLKTVTKVSGEEEPGSYDQEGNGFVIGKYLFSRDHVTSRYKVPGVQVTEFGIRYGNIPLDRSTVISEQTFLDDIPLYPIIENQDSDVSIFDLSKDSELCKKYCNNLNLDNLIKEDEIYKGMRVHWKGSPQGRDGFYRESHVANLREEQDKGKWSYDTFMINDTIVKGTSGKPIWHKDKIIGISHYVWNQMGGIGFMDNYIKSIKKYEDGANIRRRSTT